MKRSIPTVYHIRVRGRLDPARSAWLNGLTIANLDNGEAVLWGPIANRATLYGLLKKIRDLGLPLVAYTGYDPKNVRRDFTVGSQPLTLSKA